MDLPADDAEAEHAALVVEDLEPLAAAGGSTGQGYARAPSPPLPRPSVAASGDQGKYFCSSAQSWGTGKAIEAAQFGGECCRPENYPAALANCDAGD